MRKLDEYRGRIIHLKEEHNYYGMNVIFIVFSVIVI